MERNELWGRRERRVVSRHEENYWTVDENDPVIKKLIASGKIQFAFKERWGIDDKGCIVEEY